MDRYVIVYDRDEVDVLGAINELDQKGYRLAHVVAGFQRAPGQHNFTQYIMEFQGDKPKPAPVPAGIPFDDIQTLASRCNDPQMPEGVQESARLVQDWLNGE